MYKFQAGGPFTFQPYQSVYEPTGQLEIAEYMRKKYDETKENRDLIDKEIEIMEGDFFQYGAVFFEIIKVPISSTIFGALGAAFLPNFAEILAWISSLLSFSFGFVIFVGCEVSTFIKSLKMLYPPKQNEDIINFNNFLRLNETGKKCIN